MSSRSGDTSIAVLTALLLMLWLTPQTVVGQSDPGFRWQEGANIKVNHDLTTELQNEQSCVINPTDADARMDSPQAEATGEALPGGELST